MPEPGALFLVGPTASGKSEAGLLLAEALGGEILSLDAMAVYRGMDIATAKPDAQARRRIPHHGIDLVAASEKFHLKAFLDLAEKVLEDARSRAKPLMLVGGTGFYLHRLREGLFEGPGADWPLRRRLMARAEAEGAGALHAELAGRDPEAAASIHVKDLRRTVRALEVCLGSARPFSTWKRETRRGSLPEAPVLGIRRSREDLHRRIELRVEAMFARGLVEETRRLAKEGLSLSASQALGTKEVLAFLAGDHGLDEAVALVKRRTRQFAKRQMTWFRRFPEIRWIDAGPEEPADRLSERLLEALRDAA